MFHNYPAEQEAHKQGLKIQIAELEAQSIQLEKHRGQMDSLSKEFQVEQLAQTAAHQSDLQSEQEAQFSGCEAELQKKYQVPTQQLKAEYLSNLDSLEESYVSKIHSIRDEHRRALEDLERCLLEKLQEKETDIQTRLAQQAELLRLQHDQEMLLCKDQFEKQTASLNMGKLEVMASELETFHKLQLEEQLTTANAMVNEREKLLREKENLILEMLSQQEELQIELTNLKKKLDQREEETHQILEQVKAKDKSIADLQIHIGNLRIQVKQLQETLLQQGAELNSEVDLLQDLRKHVMEAEDFTKTFSQATDKPKSFTDTCITMSPWDSPELVRKQDISMEHLHILQGAISFAEGNIVYSTDLEAVPAKSLVLEGDELQLQGLFSSGIHCSKERVDIGALSFSGSSYSIAEPQDAQKINLENQVSSSFPKPACEYSSYALLDLESNLSQALEESEHLSVQFLAYLQNSEMADDSIVSANEIEVTELEQLSPVLQIMLDMVHKESCNILACSEQSVMCKVAPKNSQHSTGLESGQQERLRKIKTLQDFLTNTTDKRDQDAEDSPCDWRGEILHNVQSLFEKEHISVHAELHSHPHDHSSGDKGSLMEKLEHILKEQEGQQHLDLEHLLSLDRSSLLREIQDLWALLRMTDLQNKEKLQQLQESVTSAEELGSKSEHKLRKQVELLEYKLQQEISMVNDLQCSLIRQQEQLTEQSQQLKEEKNTTSGLRNELWNSKQELERLVSSHQALQQEISRLSYTLESKKQDLLGAVQSLQREHEKGKEWQAPTEQDQHQNHQEDQKANIVEDLKSTLEEKNNQNKQLSIALEHEQASNRNLRQELQIEYSRCEALLSQERSKLSDFQHMLTLERQRSEDLATTVNYERTVLEQLTKRHQDESSPKDHNTLMEQSFVECLQTQLKEERKHAEELADMMEKTQQQADLAKRQAEAELQKSHDDIQKEREFSKKVQSTLELLQREKEALLLIMREQDRGKQEQQDWERKQEQRAEVTQKNWQELELQHQRDQQKIKELQEMATQLADKECQTSSQKQEQGNPFSPVRNNDSEQCSPSIGAINLQKLEKIQQRLLFTAVHLKEFVHKVADRPSTDLSNEVSMVSLLRTLGELKLELNDLCSTAQKHLHAPNVLLLENEELTKSLNSLTEEKLKLQKEKENLKKNLQHYLSREAAEEQVQKLYMKYLRAESYRKALVYQKKYLLLLLGGFQDCEQATLSLIARMGVYPSPLDLQISSMHSPAFMKFRSAVRTIIAISRLGFLVKKWHKLNKKEGQKEDTTQSTAALMGTRSKIPGQRHQRNSSNPNSSPAQDTASSHEVSSTTYVNSSAKSSQNCVSLESSSTSIQDPEQSLTEYIYHLEVIQKRLGGLQQEAPVGHVWRKNSGKSS